MKTLIATIILTAFSSSLSFAMGDGDAAGKGKPVVQQNISVSAANISGFKSSLVKHSIKTVGDARDGGIPSTLR